MAFATVVAMLIGAHILIYSENPELDRAFVRDVLGFPGVDVGGGWLIFKLPPAEAAFHPVDEGSTRQRHAERDLQRAVVYLMCDDLDAYVKLLSTKNVRCTEIERAEWGIKTTITLPSGGEIGLYQPLHKTALDL
jgi:catechol 2,3-dioxygenase-like lactoylglutathione lyase family enzyme